jgi:hypothetical protein
LSTAERPRRILAIDGGGLRGVVAIAFLQKLEAKLKAEHGAGYAIRDHFDLIGGTSTGALLATGLALGQTPDQLLALYMDMAPKVFRPRFHRVRFVQAAFLANELERHIRLVTGDRLLSTPDIKPGQLSIVCKRVDTGSVWFLTNNPRSKFWTEGGEHKANSLYPLARVVRASAAAPTYFDPQEIEVAPGVSGMFVDGAVSPHNNPALALFQIATIPAYGYGWPVGADKLDITSIGTGNYRYHVQRGWFSGIAAGLAVQALEGMIADADVAVMTLMQSLGINETPWWINGELGDLAGIVVPTEPMFRFRRYNLLLEKQWLKSELGLELDDQTLAAHRRLDRLGSMQPLYELARRAADRQLPVPV